MPTPAYTIEAIEVELALFEDGHVELLVIQLKNREPNLIARDIWCRTLEDLIHETSVCHGVPVDAWHLEPTFEAGGIIELLPALVEDRSPTHVPFIKSAIASL
ncbi:hypothetical protein K8U54_21565 [Pseudomonas fulva]|uniref:hypothetical protein n=1 Tax=Pseudomonas fulva TaxID=47880 RepID=UPI00201D4661|nr:hypothetical protein [Pseudomonas fulva]UQY34267.1 hypothetical protein K8U54_21565 [Pseudomonas fulva]